MDSRSDIDADHSGSTDHFNVLCTMKAKNPTMTHFPCFPYPKMTFGPIFWEFLHKVAFTHRYMMTEETVIEVCSILDGVMRLFPCLMCRESYAKLLKSRLPLEEYVCKGGGGCLEVDCTDVDCNKQPNYKLFYWTCTFTTYAT